MKIISHRGNINGIVTDKENAPSYIDSALGLGYDVEIDVRIIDGEFFLGHDYPQFQVTKKWLELRSSRLWMHCKDLESVKSLSRVENARYFCHKSDPYVLTNTGHIWVHDLTMNIDQMCIIPLLSKEDVIQFDRKIPYAVCTDYPAYAVYDLSAKGLR